MAFFQKTTNPEAVRYTYDAAGRLVKMETYRQNSSGAGSYPVAQWTAGDATQWVYHAGTMALQQKLDAATKGAVYTYDAKGPLLTREWARLKAGSTTAKVLSTYTHNRAGELIGISYNDGVTPAVTLTRDNSGHIATINDGAGARTFTYNDAGRLAAEQSGTGILPVLPTTLTRTYDATGRPDALTLSADPNGTGTASLAAWQGWDYDAATGQLAGLSLPDGRIERSVMQAGRTCCCG